jgi:exopolysaccharide production protein ExoQ
MSATMAQALSPAALPAPAQAIPIDGDPHLFRRARTWWLLLALTLLVQGNGIFTRQDETYWSLAHLSQKFDSKPNLLWLTGVMCVIFFGLMIGHLAPTLRMMLRQKAVLAFAVLAFLSTVWSEDPLLTFRKATLLFLTFIFAWFFATCYSPQDQMRIVLATGVIVAIASIAMAILLPQFGISKDGEWKGIFGQKNELGIAMFLLFSPLPFCRIASRRRLLTVVLQATLPISLIVLSQSKEAIIIAILFVAVRILGPFIVQRRRDQLPFVLYSTVVGLPALALVLIAGKDFFLGLLGKEGTLTGRTEHWAIEAQYIASHLWLGYGYHAFWTGTGDSLNVVRAVGGAMKGSDSGYVDMLLNLGLAGIVLLMVLLLVCVGDFLRVLRRPSVPIFAFWYAGLILGVYAESFVGNTFPDPAAPGCFMFVVACAGLNSLLHENASDGPAASIHGKGMPSYRSAGIA